jgi:hypothetical protein
VIQTRVVPGRQALAREQALFLHHIYALEIRTSSSLTQWPSPPQPPFQPPVVMMQRQPTHTGHTVSTITPTTYYDATIRTAAIGHDARALLGRVMSLVAATVAFAALGLDFTGTTGLLSFIGVFAAIVGLNTAIAKGREPLAIGLRFGLALLWQAAGTTAAFVAAVGAYGYATRRDLSAWARPLL